MERYWYDERGNIFEAGAVEHYAPGTNRLRRSGKKRGQRSGVRPRLLTENTDGKRFE